MIRYVMLFSAALLLTGCLVNVNSDGRILSSTWDEGDVSRLQVGRSDAEWVRTTFGEPGTRLSYANGSEVWKYRNRSEKDTEVGIFLIFSVDVEQERVDTLSIEFTDGVVSNYWVEGESF